jgi:hypothetical protein
VPFKHAQVLPHLAIPFAVGIPLRKHLQREITDGIPLGPRLHREIGPRILPTILPQVINVSEGGAGNDFPCNPLSFLSPPTATGDPPIFCLTLAVFPVLGVHVPLKVRLHR